MEDKDFQIKMLQDHVAKLEREKIELEIQLVNIRYWVKFSLDLSMRHIMAALNGVGDKPPILRHE